VLIQLTKSKRTNQSVFHFFELFARKRRLFYLPLYLLWSIFFGIALNPLSLFPKYPIKTNKQVRRRKQVLVASNLQLPIPPSPTTHPNPPDASKTPHTTSPMFPANSQPSPSPAKPFF